MDTDQKNDLLDLQKTLDHPPSEEVLSDEFPVALVPKEGYALVDKLTEIIKDNILGCDLVICFFIAAIQSYRVDACVRPFPQYFIKNNEKDFEALKIACSKIPPLKDFVSLPARNIPKDAIEILTWLFIDSGLPVLNLCSLKNVPLSIVNEKASVSTLPQYVFKVTFSEKIEEIWNKRLEISNKNTFFALHGSSVDNFYSILKFGLQHHFSRGKEVLYGSGIYLSNEISVSTNYAPFGETWKNSLIGNKHSIIAVCEVINDKEEVRCKDENNKQRVFNKNSYGEIPEKYFVVTNSELVKVKYLLVYRQKAPSRFKSFVKRNLLWLGIALYFVALVFIGFFNGPYWRKFVRYLNTIIE